MSATILPNTHVLLGIDIGTTLTKAAMFDSAGNELARAVSPPFQLFSPKPGWMEQDPEALWQSVLNVLRTVMLLGGDHVHVDAICIAAQSGSLLPVDENGSPICNLITWMDGRSENIVSRWRDQGLEEMVRTATGWSLYPGLSLPTIAWLRENDPVNFAKSRHFFTVNDFIAYRLTGKKINNPSNAGGMQLVDIQSGDWSSTVCKLAGISSEQVSPIQPAGAIIGAVKADICRETGVNLGAVLVNGGHDQVCTAFGLGVNDPGKILVACGTAWVITGIVDKVEINRMPVGLDLNFHVIPQRWTLSQSLGGLGAALEWWVEQCWAGARNQNFASLTQELCHVRKNPDLLFLPITGGSSGPATTRLGGFWGLQFGQTRAEMAQAIMESAAFELRWALSKMVSQGIQIDRVWLVGGASKSNHWLQIIADTCKLPLYISEYDIWPAFGAAILAGLGVGWFQHYKNGTEVFHKSFHEIHPNPKNTTYFDSKFEQYRNCDRAYQQFINSASKKNVI